MILLDFFLMIILLYFSLWKSIRNNSFRCLKILTTIEFAYIHHYNKKNKFLRVQAIQLESRESMYWCANNGIQTSADMHMHNIRVKRVLLHQRSFCNDYRWWQYTRKGCEIVIIATMTLTVTASRKHRLIIEISTNNDVSTSVKNIVFNTTRLSHSCARFSINEIC